MESMIKRLEEATDALQKVDDVSLELLELEGMLLRIIEANEKGIASCKTPDCHNCVWLKAKNIAYEAVLRALNGDFMFLELDCDTIGRGNGGD